MMWCREGQALTKILVRQLMRLLSSMPRYVEWVKFKLRTRRGWSASRSCRFTPKKRTDCTTGPESRPGAKIFRFELHVKEDSTVPKSHSPKIYFRLPSKRNWIPCDSLEAKASDLVHNLPRKQWNNTTCTFITICASKMICVYERCAFCDCIISNYVPM